MFLSTWPLLLFDAVRHLFVSGVAKTNEWTEKRMNALILFLLWWVATSSSVTIMIVWWLRFNRIYFFYCIFITTGIARIIAQLPRALLRKEEMTNETCATCQHLLSVLCCSRYCREVCDHLEKNQLTSLAHLVPS